MVHGFDNDTIELVEFLDLNSIGPLLSRPAVKRVSLRYKRIVWPFFDVFHGGLLYLRCCTLDSLRCGFMALHAKMRSAFRYELWNFTDNRPTHTGSSSLLALFSE